MKNKKILTSILTLLITATIFAACSSDNNNQPQQTRHVQTLPSSLDPAMSNDQTSDNINAYIHSTLVSLCEETSQPIPALAIMWDQSDDRTINMMLRQNAMFHNGDPLTAHDVAFSLFRASAIPQSKDILGIIDSVTVHNDHNFTISLTEPPQTTFLLSLAHPNSAILPHRHIAHVGEEAFALNPIGAGAYVFEYIIPGERISLTGNPNYWGETPHFERITFEIANTG